jgi:hypothetical protein
MKPVAAHLFLLKACSDGPYLASLIASSTSISEVAPEI